MLLRFERNVVEHGDNEELHNLCPSPSIIRIVTPKRMRWTGNVARMGDERNACKILVVTPEVNIILGRRRHRLVDNIKIGLQRGKLE
jgi:hypothetical protein